MLTAMDFKIGERVFHVNHGKGIIYAYRDFPDEIFVEFDVKPEGWDKILCVSSNNLKKI